MKKTELRIPSTNGTDQLHTIIWEPEEKEEIKGVIQISHGMTEYLDRYHRFADYMVSEGYAVIGNDHLGHGETAKDDDDLGYMASENPSLTIVRDLHRVTKFAKKRYPDKPYILLGHSMGSFLARRYACMYGKELDALIIMGTGYQPKPVILAGYLVSTLEQKLHGERFRSTFVKNSSFGSYNKRVDNPHSVNAWLTRDVEMVNKYDRDKFCTFSFTVNAYRALFRTLWFIESKKNYQRIPKDLQILFVSGSADPVGNYAKGVKKVISDYKKAGIKNIESIFYPEARHEILNELEYEKTQKDIADWIKKEGIL